MVLKLSASLIIPKVSFLFMIICFLFVCLFCCFTSQVNSYHYHTKSMQNKPPWHVISKLFDTLVVFLKEFFKKVDFDKISRRPKSMQNFPVDKELSVILPEPNIWEGPEYEKYQHYIKLLLRSQLNWIYTVFKNMIYLVVAW